MAIWQGFNWLDWVLVILLVFSFVYGYQRGLVGLLAGLLAYFLALFIAGRYTAPLVEWLERSYETTSKLADTLSHHVNLPAEANQIPAQAIPWEKVVLWFSLPLPQEYKVQLAKKVEAWSASGAQVSVADFLFNEVATGILSAAVFLVLAGVTGYVLAYAGKLISEYMSSLPLLGFGNRAFGAVAGLLATGSFMAVFFSVVTPLLSLKMFSSIAGAMSGSKVAEWLITYQPIVSKWIMGQGSAFFFSRY
jgi:uncharacterized membrane protein required for colicin V production